MVDVATPAIGFSITANLGGERQIVFQHFVGQDEDDKTVNARLDRLMMFVDRLKAKTDLPELRDELAKLETTLAQFEEDRARLETEHVAAQARLDLQGNTLAKDIDKLLREGEAAFRAAGRQGAYTPQGLAKASIERVQFGLNQVTEEKARASAERDQALANMAISVKRYSEHIETLKAKIAEREKAI